MGILKQHIHLLCREQKRSIFIKGNALIISQQSVFASEKQVLDIVAQYQGLSFSSTTDDFKRPTKSYPNITAKTLLTLFGADKIQVSDAFDYEDPDLIIDLNEPVPSSLHNSFDTIIECGTLEHIFDIATALTSIVKMLKIDGSLMLCLPSSNVIDHGFYSISPTLLYDFFEANGINIRSCYLREGSPFNYGRKGRVFSYEGPKWDTPITSSGSMEVCFFATKIRESSSSLAIKPTQSRYKHLNPLDSITSSRSVLGDWAGEVNDEVSKGLTSTKYKLFRLAISPIILFKSIFKIDFPLPLHCYINTHLGKRFGRSNLKFIGRY